MKVAIAQYPVLTDVEMLPRSQAASQSRPMDRAKVMSYVTSAVIVVSCRAMTYGFITYCRVVQNYLQW